MKRWFYRAVLVSMMMKSSFGCAEQIVLRNASVEAVIRPDIGRVISFSRVGESNVLWVADDPLAFDPTLPNYGGLRVLISPQGLWDQIHQANRPDPATDGGPWTVVEKEARHVQMTTFSSDLGVQIVWDVRMHESRPELTMHYRMTRTAENPFPVHVWSIAQAPVGGEIYLESQPHIKTPYHNFLRIPGGLKPFMEPVLDARAYRFVPGSWQEPLKTGTFGRWIAYVAKQQAFIQIGPALQKLPYSDRSNLQAFLFPRVLPFCELEITSPTYSLRLGESFEMEETWLLADVPQGSSEETAEEIERLVQKTIQSEACE